jgi:hypothetical protein
MEEEVWRLGQQLRVLREFRAEVRGIWDDSASRDLNSRDLDPHDADGEHLLESLRAQKEAMGRTQIALTLSEEWAASARGHAMKVMEHLILAREQTAPAYHEFEQYMTYEGRARDEFMQIIRLLRQANCACG